MKAGLEELTALKDRLPSVIINNKSRAFNYALVQVLELEGMLDIAQAVALGAYMRQESRGSHARTDYPERDDERFLRHTMARQRDGKIEIQYAPVTLGRFPVKERQY
jgi:succinate dehydrogenase / fumarate reductase flavoprotein subunit